MDEGVFHVRTDGGEPLYGDGPAERPDARLTLDADTCIAVADGSLPLGHAIRDGRAQLETLPHGAQHGTLHGAPHGAPAGAPAEAQK